MLEVLGGILSDMCRSRWWCCWGSRFFVGGAGVEGEERDVVCLHPSELTKKNNVGCAKTYA